MPDPNAPIRPPDPPLLPDQPGALAARFSVDEVALLASLLGLTPPPSVATAVLAVTAAGTTASTDDAIAAAVRRGLFARGVLEVDADDQLRMDDDVVAILSTICRPSMVLAVTSGRGALARRRTIYAMPGGAVVESSREVGGQGVMDYMSLPIESIMPSVVQWTGLDDRPAPAAGAPFTVIAEDVARAGEAIAAGDADSAAAILQAATDSDDSASAAAVYLRAMADQQVSANSVMIQRRVNDQLAVGLTAWNDCGTAGLWLLERDDALALREEDAARITGEAGEPGEPGELAGDVATLDSWVLQAPVTVRPISGNGVLDLLMSRLPQPPLLT